MLSPSLAGSDNGATSCVLYVLGLLSEEERENFELHLSECDACRSEVEKQATTIAQLALRPPLIPSEHARTKFACSLKNENSEHDPSQLKNVLITAELSHREPQGKNAEQVEFVLHQFAGRVFADRQQILDQMVRAAFDLCDAGTAGFSLLIEDQEVFRWDALAGALESDIGGTTPRDWSPCGTTLDCGAPQLFSYPIRCFDYFKNAAEPIVEGLVVPVYVEQKPLGTLWIASHDERRKFDREDLRVMNCLAHLCSSAISAMHTRSQANG